MVNRPDKYGKTCLDGWQMNSQQRRFLESFFSAEEEQKLKATAEGSVAVEPDNSVLLKEQAATFQLKRIS